MNKLQDLKIENLIYEIREKQVVLDFEISRAKCHYYPYANLITHKDIGRIISLLFKYVFTKFRKEIKI